MGTVRLLLLVVVSLGAEEEEGLPVNLPTLCDPALPLWLHPQTLQEAASFELHQTNRGFFSGSGARR